MNGGAKQASLGCFRATFTPQYSLYCLTKEPLFHTNSGSSWSGKEAFLVYYGGNIAAKYHKNSNPEL